MKLHDFGKRIEIETAAVVTDIQQRSVLHNLWIRVVYPKQYEMESYIVTLSEVVKDLQKAYGSVSKKLYKLSARHDEVMETIDQCMNRFVINLETAMDDRGMTVDDVGDEKWLLRCFGSAFLRELDNISKLKSLADSIERQMKPKKRLGDMISDKLKDVDALIQQISAALQMQVINDNTTKLRNISDTAMIDDITESYKQSVYESHYIKNFKEKTEAVSDHFDDQTKSYSNDSALKDILKRMSQKNEPRRQPNAN